MSELNWLDVIIEWNLGAAKIRLLLGGVLLFARIFFRLHLVCLTLLFITLETFLMKYGLVSSSFLQLLKNKYASNGNVVSLRIRVAIIKVQFFSL